MAAYVYMKDTGRLYSWNPGDDDPVAPDDVLEKRGMALVKGLPPLDATHEWDEKTRTVVT